MRGISFVTSNASSSFPLIFCKRSGITLLITCFGGDRNWRRRLQSKKQIARTAESAAGSTGAGAARCTRFLPCEHRRAAPSPINHDRARRAPEWRPLAQQSPVSVTFHRPRGADQSLRLRTDAGLAAAPARTGHRRADQLLSDQPLIGTGGKLGRDAGFSFSGLRTRLPPVPISG